MKKFLISSLLLSILLYSPVYAQENNTNKINLSDMFMSWSVPLNRRVVVNLPEQQKFNILFAKEDSINIKNTQDLESAINPINGFLERKNLIPVQFCLFPNALVIIPISTDCANN